MIYIYDTYVHIYIYTHISCVYMCIYIYIMCICILYILCVLTNDLILVKKWRPLRNGKKRFFLTGSR